MDAFYEVPVVLENGCEKDVWSKKTIGSEYFTAPNLQVYYLEIGTSESA